MNYNMNEWPKLSSEFICFICLSLCPLELSLRFVSKMWVVTVASCLYSGNKVSDNDQFKVVINTEYIHGPLGSQSNGFNVDHVIPHPGFNMSDARSRNENNIGLLRLQNRLWVTGLTKEALIENWWDPRLQLQKIYVAGWGSERDLESYTKQISSHVFVALPNSQCKYYYNYKLYDETRHFCGYFEDNRQPCSGDQGDGMVVHDPQAGGWVLVGIVHHHNGTGCTTKYEHESIIVIRISGFYHWINGAIKKVDKEWPMTG